MRTGKIYLCKNLINEKVYIGQTVQKLQRRIDHHLQDAKKDNLYFHKAIIKYGKDNFKWSILEDNIQIDILDEKEMYYISKYESNISEKGYNLTNGGRDAIISSKLKEEQVESIKDLLLNTKQSLTSIANDFNISIYAISDINNGKSWKTNIEYPIRKTNRAKRLPTKIVESIIQELILDELPTMKIAEKHNINFTTVIDIMNGRIHKKESLSYPLRIINNNKHKSLLKLNDEKVIEIIDLLENTNMLIKDIAIKFNAAPTTIADINKGRSWKQIHNKQIPIRKK